MQGFLSPGPGLSYYPRPLPHTARDSVTSTDEKVADTHGDSPNSHHLFLSLAEPWVYSVAIGSDLVVFFQPQGEAKAVTPFLFSRDCFRSGHVIQIWPLKCEGKSAGRGRASGKCFFCLTLLPCSRLECCCVRHDVGTCSCHPATMRQ